MIYTKMIGIKPNDTKSHGNKGDIWVRHVSGTWMSNDKAFTLTDSEIEHDLKLGYLIPLAETLLWLDDIRNPFLNNENKVPNVKGKLIWVLNYEQFVEWITKFGMPDIISFDHDLADEHYTPEQYWSDYQASKEYQEAQSYVEKTGYDCAKWLVDYCMDNDLDLPIYFIHSANPVGADNIKGLLDNYNKFRNENRN